MSNESYLVANGWITGSNPKWYRHLSLTGGNEAYETSAMKLQRSYDMGRADALAEVRKPEPERSEKDEVMSKISYPFTLDTAVLSSERVLLLPNSDYGIKLNVKNGEPSVILEIGGLIVNRYDTVVEALSRAYIGFYVEHLIEEKYSVTPKENPEPGESDEEFILRHMWWKTSSGTWVHNDVRHTDGNHVTFLHPLSAAAVQRAINRAAENAVPDADAGERALRGKLLELRGLIDTRMDELIGDFDWQF